MPDLTLRDRTSSKPKTTALLLIVATVSAILLLIVLQMRGTWENVALTLQPSTNLSVEGPDELNIVPDDMFVDVFHEGCSETYRYSVEETATEIRVRAERKQQTAYDACLTLFQERLELQEPIGDREIVDEATGETLHPSS